MQTLDEINPHLGLCLSESYVSPREREWEHWVRRAEKLLGHDLDGNQGTDGYSLDYAYDHFDAGDTPTDYVTEVIAAKAALAAARESAS